jgi:tetratricopeptide (TPR) repeat protein
LRLDPRTPLANVTMGEIFAIGDWNWAAAEREFTAAIRLAPGVARYHHAYAYVLAAQGRLGPALAEMGRAAALDPLSPAVNADFARLYLWAGDPDRALAYCRIARDAAPPHARVRADWCSVHAALAAGDAAAAQAAARAVAAAHGHEGTFDGVDAFFQWALGRPGVIVDPYERAALETALRLDDAALDSLALAADRRTVSLLGIGVDPRFERLRRTGRLTSLLSRMALPAALERDRV